MNCVEDFKNPITSALIGVHDKLTVLVIFWRRGNCVKMDETAKGEVCRTAHIDPCIYRGPHTPLS